MNWIVDNRQSMLFFAPEMLLAFSAMGILLLGAFLGLSRRLALALGGLSVAGFIFASYYLATTKGLSSSLFAGMIAMDGFAVFFKIFLGLVTLATFYFIGTSKELHDYDHSEIVPFLLVITMGMSLMAASTDLLMMYLAFEMVSILSYIMVGLKRNSRPSTEAGLKYIIFGGVSSGLMIFGLSFLFGIAGSTDLRDIAVSLREIEGISMAPLLLFSLLCTMAGFGFKMATFPTQMWCPDVYEGAPTPITAFLSVGPKAAGFAMTIRFFYTVLGLDSGQSAAPLVNFIEWGSLIGLLAALTMTFGNLAALWQRNLKRLMAYSSIAHAGYLLMGFSAFSEAGMEAILFYLVVYFLMNFGAFLVIIAIANETGTEEIDGYRGLGSRALGLGVLLTFFLFSLTGLPPFAGFAGKFLLFWAVIKQEMYWLAAIAMINTVISLFYYVRIVKVMFLESPLEKSVLNIPLGVKTATAIFAIPTLVLGIWWEPLTKVVQLSLQGLF